MKESTVALEKPTMQIFDDDRLRLIGNIAWSRAARFSSQSARVANRIRGIRRLLESEFLKK